MSRFRRECIHAAVEPGRVALVRTSGARTADILDERVLALNGLAAQPGDALAPVAALLERPEEVKLRDAVTRLIDQVCNAVPSFQLSHALRDTWEVIAETNRYIVTREPWKLAKAPGKGDELATSLYVAADTLRVIAELLRPFMPGTAERTLAMLGVTPAPAS